MTKITRKMKSTSYNTLTCFFDQGGKHLNETLIHFVILPLIQISSGFFFDVMESDFNALSRLKIGKCKEFLANFEQDDSLTVTTSFD